MKTHIIFIFLVCLSQVLLSQTIKVYKTDNSVVEFNVADVDSMNLSSTPGGSIVNASSWICFTNGMTLSKVQPSAGVYEEAEDGLKVYGASVANTVNLMPAYENSLITKTLYLKWKINGSGRPVTVGVELYSGVENLTSVCKALSVSTNMGLIKDNTWYYTRITISNDKINSVTSGENYDNKGGFAISNSSSSFNGDIRTFAFQAITDKLSYFVLSDCRIE